MTWHPLALGVWSFDVGAWFLAMIILTQLLSALPGWDIQSASREQLARERIMERVIEQGRWLFQLQAGAFLFLVIGVAIPWPKLIAGAMCGTGALQAMGAAGDQTLFIRGVTLLLLAAWRATAGICRQIPDTAVWPLMGRTLLPALPLIALGTISWGQAMDAMKPDQVVNCCALIYTAVGDLLPATMIGITMGHAWLLAVISGAAGIAVFEVFHLLRPVSEHWFVRLTETGGMIAWLAMAAIAVSDGVAPYIFQVLGHRCPWCLLLMDHWGAGFLLYGSLAVMAMEQAAILATDALGRHLHPAAEAARVRIRSARVRILAAALVFAVSAGGPIIHWRISTGGWLF